LCKTKIDSAQKTNKVKNKFKNKISKKFSYKQNTLENKSDSDNDGNYTIAINQINNDEINEKKWFQTILVNGIEIKFQLDSGAETNILPLKLYNNLKKKKEIRKTKVKIESYGGYKLEPVGTVILECEIKEFKTDVKCIILDNLNCVPILGLNTCITLNLIKRINKVNVKYSVKLDNFIKENKDIFEGKGTFSDVMKIKLSKDAVPIAIPSQRVPLTIKNQLGEILKLLTKKGIIQPVTEPLEWVSNIVIIEKPNKTLRICIDPYELNKHIVRYIYPVPTLEEITPKLNNKNIFCVFDIKDAFYHIKIDDKSSNYCTFSSPYGCFKFLRAPFGLASIPEIFQKLVNKYFGHIKNVIVYFDDILCATNTIKEMDDTVKEVISRAKQFNIKFNPDKIQ